MFIAECLYNFFTVQDLYKDLLQQRNLFYMIQVRNWEISYMDYMWNSKIHVLTYLCVHTNNINIDQTA